MPLSTHSILSLSPLALILLAAACSPDDLNVLDAGATFDDDTSGGTSMDPDEADPDEVELEAACDEGCGLAAASKPAEAATRIRGWLTFDPSFLTTEGTGIATNLGQIPGSNNSYARMRYLFVCAYDEDGTSPDFDAVTSTPFSGNDDLLGCDRADNDGYYDITVSGLASSWGDDVYLMTWFCDDADFPLTSAGGTEYDDDAEVCVRMNVGRASESTAIGRHRKFLRSRVYDDELVWGGVTTLNWNLSCPNLDGNTGGLQRLTCPANAVDPNTTANTNSNAAYNMEFVHLFRTAIEPVRSFGSLEPRASAIATQGCGNFGLQPCPVCDDDLCHEEINLVVRPATVSGWSAPCATTGGNSSQGYNNTCIAHGTAGERGTRNPFRPIHEIGHNLHRRWMRDSGNIEQGFSAQWSTGGSESSATAEGYANFVAVASWYPDSSDDPVYDDLYDDSTGSTVQVEPAGAASLAGTCGAGTGCGCSEGNLLGNGRTTQFFWDLYDADDWIDLSFWDILRVWSTFSNGDGDAQSNECGPDGRNLEDFRTKYDLLRARPDYSHWPSIDTMMTANCVDRHIDGATTCG